MFKDFILYRGVCRVQCVYICRYRGKGDMGIFRFHGNLETGVAKRLRGTLVCLMEVAKRLRGILVCFIGVAKRLHGNYDTETL